MFKFVFDPADQFHCRSIGGLFQSQRDPRNARAKNVPERASFKRTFLIAFDVVEKDRRRRFLLGDKIADGAHFFFAADRVLDANQIAHLLHAFEPLAQVLYRSLACGLRHFLFPFSHQTILQKFTQELSSELRALWQQ